MRQAAWSRMNCEEQLTSDVCLHFETFTVIIQNSFTPKLTRQLSEGEENDRFKYTLRPKYLSMNNKVR